MSQLAKRLSIVVAVALFSAACGDNTTSPQGDAGVDAGLPDGGDGGVPSDGGMNDGGVPSDAGPTSSMLLYGGVIVLDGGSDQVTLADETWQWKNGAWTQLAVSGPGARAYATGANLDGTGVLFGGEDDSGGSLGDTWVWDGSAWANRTQASSEPGARQSAMMASLNGAALLYGGIDIVPSLGVTQLGDQALFTIAAGWVPQAGANPPGARGDSGMAALGSHIILFGGNAMGNRKGDTWQWDGSKWTQLNVTGPAARSRPTMATLGNKLVLFGGEGANGMLSDTWLFDGAAWTQVSGSGPSAREDAAAAAVGNKLVLFGGDNGIDATSILGETWIFDGAVWTQSTGANPPARTAATAFGL